MKLSSEQQAVVDASDLERASIVACPGSGKTTTVVELMTKWLRTGTDPRTCAMITYTRRAAREMYSRLRAAAGPAGDDIYVGTFHSLCFSFVCENWKALGYTTPKLMVLDAEDCKLFLKRALDAIRDKRITIAMDVLTAYGAGGPVSPVIRAYQDLLTQENACDYSLLARMVLELAMRDEGVREAIRFRCRNMIVDEYQDADPAQHNFYLLAANRLYVVGDPDQTIFSWRGADHGLLAEVPKFGKRGQLFELTVNHRSDPAIVARAEQFRQTVEPLAFGRKPMVPARVERSPTAVNVVRDEVVDAHLPALKTDAESVVILARTNYILSEWSRRLTNCGVKHTLFGGAAKLLENTSVKLAMAYLAWPDMPDAGPITDRVIRAEGGSELDMASARTSARSTARTMMQAATAGESKLELSNFYTEISDLGIMERMASCCVRARMKRGGLDPTAYQELTRRLARYVAETPRRFWSGSGFFNWLASQDIHDVIRDDAVGIQLMTAHASKGLEFDHVVVVGMGDTEFPWRKTFEPNPAQEERRLFYVAVTRAKRSVTLVMPGAGKRPSPFIEEYMRA